MRMFVAVVPPDKILDELGSFLETRRDVDAPLRWTSPEQWHLTLAFLGSVDDRHLDELTERLARAAGKRAPFALRLAGGGGFPDVARARVLWMGLAVTWPAGLPGRDDPSAADPMGPTCLARARQVSASEELSRLATGARSAASKTGIAVDGARFHPHLTLARLNHPRDVTRWLRVLDAFAGGGWVADGISLIESHLGEGPNGKPRYESRATFRLG
ncbi:MAG: RNA 2',3'-cyclic phosphodiesterase [Nocardioidaceae bacterium]